MSRVPKWHVEKAKVKVVFRLQFHATHIPQSGWDKLFVSFIPADTGKATAKTTKANVRNGNCKWSDPIYETTRLLQDTRSRKYDEKCYKLLVAMGSSRSSLLGEVMINLADFVDASKPSSVALPLHGCDYGTILHVTVQLLTSKTGFREFEQQREHSVKGFQALSGQRSSDPTEALTASVEMGSKQLDKVSNARVRFKENYMQLPLLEEVGESNEDYEGSAAGIDDSSNTSDSLYADKNEVSSIHEVDNIKSTGSGDTRALAAVQSPRIVKDNKRDIRLSIEGSNDWSHGWSSDYSADNDLTPAFEENNRLRVRLEGAEASLVQIKAEVKSLQSLCDELGTETHSLAKQLAIELASGEKLVREVSIMKSECSKFKTELEELKSAKAVQYVPGTQNYQYNFSNQCQIKWLQGLLLVEEKVREIQNKACLGPRESEFNVLNSDFEVLHCIIHNLKEESSIEFQEETHIKEMQFKTALRSEHFIHGQVLEGSYLDTNAARIMEEKMCKLLQTLEDSDTEKGILTKKLDQMECYYEALIQQLEESRHQTVSELETLRNEHSSCLYTISALQGQTEKLQKDINEQFVRFAGDRHDLDYLNKELEKRAVASETALKRVRLNYAIAVERLQKDLELLSFQVLSMYETNENLAKQALIDVPQLFPHETSPDQQYKPGIVKLCSESLSNETDSEKSTTANGESDLAGLGTVLNFNFNKDNENFFSRGLPRNVDIWTRGEGNACANEMEIHKIGSNTQLKSIQQETDVICREQTNEIWKRFPIVEPKGDSENHDMESNNQPLSENSSSGEIRSLHKLQKLQADTEVELSEMHFVNMHWEVFTEVLKQTMHFLDDEMIHLKEEMAKLAQQLKLSTFDNESLMLKLHTAYDDIRNLRKDEVNCQSKCDGLALKNHILEAKVEDVLEENNALTRKVSEYENKYKICLEERNRFEVMLKDESLQRSCLQSEISSTVEDFKTLKEGFDNLRSENSELQETLSCLQKQLEGLCCNLLSLSEEIDGITIDGLSLQQEMKDSNYVAVVLHLEQFQQEAFKKILQLRHEKKEIEEDRDIARSSLNKTESQILLLKQKFDAELEETRMKLDLSNSIVEKLQLELQDIADKLKFSVEAEERQKNANRELSSKLTILEIEVQQANDENRDFTQKILEFDNVKEELERTKLILLNCMQEKRALVMSIESEKEVSTGLEAELNSLKEELKSSHDSLYTEQGSREELEATVADLTLQLKEKARQLLSYDEEKTELIVLRKKVLDVETELQHLLYKSEESQRIYDDKVSTVHRKITDLEYYLAENIDQSLSADVKFTYLRSQFQLMLKDIVDQSKVKQDEFSELHLNYVNAVVCLKDHIATEAQFAGENVRLSADLQSVKAELEDIVHEKEGLLSNLNESRSVSADIEDMKSRSAMLEAEIGRERCMYEDKLCQMRNMLLSLEEEVECLRFSKVEMETREIILKAKLDEQKAHISLLEECEYELKRLREQHSELSYKFSEQILKTEEFKNLSIHLRELKDKADAECLQARQRKETEGSTVAMQDSLRIAFIKEQCESKLQEMKSQLSASKKYAEEMLLKLQTALDEVENGKRREVSLAKRNEELSLKISDMEAELQTVVTERRELVKTCDRMKAELECTMLSLDCCKEEKLKTEDFLQECNEERTRLRVELDLVKRLLENMITSTTSLDVQNNQSVCNSNTSIGDILENGKSDISAYQEMPTGIAACSDEGTMTRTSVDLVNAAENLKLLDKNPKLVTTRQVLDVPLASNSENSHPSLGQNLPPLQDELAPKNPTDEEALLDNCGKHIADIKEHFKGQRRLLTSMDLLHKELERLKNDNLSSVVSLEGDRLDLALQGLQSDLSQLDKVNEHLGSIFPLFKELPGSGNALERVLALELELAEALQAKKTDIWFESSFLKQHNGDEAVFQSFRDINELLKDMLDVKRRNAAIENELKEMQDRYSQLSLQFAEVEGDRQQLVMTLRSRSPKKSQTTIS